MTESFDVIVVGGGNAAFCAALAAHQSGARVLMLEKAPISEIGGNTYFTAGAIRVAYDGLDELAPLLDGSDTAQLSSIDLDPYPTKSYLDDMRRITNGLCDEELTRVLVEKSLPTAKWLRSQGQKFGLLHERQSREVDGRRRFWGNLTIGFAGGGKEMINRYQELAGAAGIELRCMSHITALVRSLSGAIVGVVANGKTIHAGAVVLAAGGFESNPGLRAKFLGPSWERALVRGTRHNTGEMLVMALAAGAGSAGDWAGCHATPWEAEAPEFGDWELTNQLTKLSYYLGIMVNAKGERFVDEGSDFRNYTYARFGREILNQPEGVAYQIFDSQTFPLLDQGEYGRGALSHISADSVDALAEKLALPRLPETIARFNSASLPGRFNPAIKDGKRTDLLDPPKSNWALPLSEPPFHSFRVRCGITFTFGGLKIDVAGRVLDRKGTPMAGLLAAGEIAGGLFFGNYPGGSGLAAGAVFGRRAGSTAAAMAAALRA